MKIKIFVWLIIILLVTSCASNRDANIKYIDPHTADFVKKKATTATELERELGSPDIVIPRKDNKVMWVYKGLIRDTGGISYVRYVGLLFGKQDQKCSRLTVLVDNDSGELSEWEYVTKEDSDHWTNIDDHCD